MVRAEVQFILRVQYRVRAGVMVMEKHMSMNKTYTSQGGPDIYI